MFVFPLKSDLIEPGDSLVDSLSLALTRDRTTLRNNDIVAVSSKVVAISERRLRSTNDVMVSRDARDLARKYALTPEFAQIVLDESDRVICGVKGALLTIKEGDAVANAGVDRKNAPKDSVVLWPKDPDASAKRLRSEIKRRIRKNVGVIVVDSRVTPLRLGTTGLAIGSAGLRPVMDIRGTRDLSGRRVEITFHAIADGIAAAAQLVMGETSERRPFAVVRGAPTTAESNGGTAGAKLPWKQCLFMSQVMPAHRAKSEKLLK